MQHDIYMPLDFLLESQYFTDMASFDITALKQKCAHSDATAFFKALLLFYLFTFYFKDLLYL